MTYIFLLVFIGLVIWLVWSVERKRRNRIEDLEALEKIKSSISNNLAFDMLRDKPTIEYQDLVTFCTKKALEHNVDIELVAYKTKFTIRITYMGYYNRINISSSAVTGFDGEYVKETPPIKPYGDSI